MNIFMQRCVTTWHFAIVAGMLSIKDRAWAQLIPDTTLGTENSIVAPDLRITGGATRGGNLFHSFQELSIGPNQTAWFDNPANIQSILVRVTGKNRSDIDGTLRANGIADLFIINPNGVTFGQTAKLNIGGALSILTTPGIPLGDRGLFSATAPAQSQLLAIKPSALFDLAQLQPQGNIIFKANWEPKGQAIKFVAKSITFDQAQINNPSGNELYKAANNISPIRINLQAREGITIKDSNIGLYGGKFEAKAPGTIVLNNSRILSQSSLAAPAEGIFIDGGKVELRGSGITIPTDDILSLPNQTHKPVVLDIRSADSILIDRSRINQPTQDPGLISSLNDNDKANRSKLYPLAIKLDAKNITIQNSAIAPRGGSFEVKNMPEKFSLLNSQIFNYNYMNQASGPISIQAQEIENTKQKPTPGNTPVGPANSEVGISTAAIGRGDAGNIILNATNINVKGPQVGLGSNTITDGNAGNITLTAIEDFRFETAGIGNDVKGGAGSNGELKITARDIYLAGFGFNMNNSNLASGDKPNKGKISLNASRNIFIGQGGIIAAAAEEISINGGKVELRELSITVPTNDNLPLPDQTHKPVVLEIRSADSITIDRSKINQPDGPLIPALNDRETRSNLYPLAITLNADRDIVIQDSAIAPRGGSFEAKNIAGKFSLLNSQIFNYNYMNQASGPITIQANEIQNSKIEGPRPQSTPVGGRRSEVGISTAAIGRGDAGNIILTATNINVKGPQVGLGSNTIGDGNAGNITLTAIEDFRFDYAGIGNTTKQGKGSNGELIITARDIHLTGGFGFNMDDLSAIPGHKKGKISLIATRDIFIDEGGIGSNAKGNNPGADLVVKAENNFRMKPRTALSTSAEKDSIGGNITIEAKNQFILQGSVSTGTNGQKGAGNIDVLASQITIEPGVGQITERGNISSYTGTAKGESTTVKGNSGDISLKTIGGNGQILLRSGGGIVNTVFKSSTGNTGQIAIAQAGQLNVEGGSQIIATTNSTGQANLIDIKEIQTIKLSGSNTSGESPSGILSTIQTSAKGGSSAGININTPLLDIRDGAGIISSTLGQGNSGKVKITAGQAILSNKTAQGRSSGVLTSVGLGQIPEGTLLLEVDSLDPRFSRTTLNPLVIGKSDNPLATGDSGAISLNVGSLDILKGAQLITAIVGKGTAGNVIIQADRNIRLIDQAAIRADSGSGKGGTINLNSQNGVLFLRNGSQISAVSRSAGTDGNININVPFVVGIRGGNSDIFAVAPEALNRGRSLGNNVKITANSILGFEYRPQFTVQNDILATGDVTLNLPDIDPSRGLMVLPTTPIDIAQKIDKSCNPDAATQSSSFVTRGTGGLPASPTTSITPNGLMRLAQVGNEQTNVNISAKISPTPVEAQTSRRLANGRIRFQSKTQESLSQNHRSDCLNINDPIPLNPP
jgi:filamentous hemagglutinin family protein